MSNADRDTFVIRACAKLEVLHARFVTECEIVDNAEFDHEATPNLETAWLRAQNTLHQWRFVLRQVNQRATDTRAGAAAKIRVLRRFIEYGLCAEDDVAVLIKGLTADIDRLLKDDADWSCHNGSAAIPITWRKKDLDTV